MHFIVSSSDAVFWQNRQFANAFDHQGAAFWQNRKFVNASDCFRVRCSSLTKSKNSSVHLTYQRWMQPDENFIKSSNSISISILINISFNISNQHFSSANIISAKIISARIKYESHYISFSSIIFIFFFSTKHIFSLYIIINQD